MRTPPVRVAAGVVAGAVLGAAGGLPWGVHRALSAVADPAGRLWLGALLMPLIPLAMAVLVLGRPGLRLVRREPGMVGLPAGRVLVWTGLVILAAWWLESAGREAVSGAFMAASPIGPETLVAFVPRNPVRAIADVQIPAMVVFAVMVGIALGRLTVDRARPVRDLCESLALVSVEMLGLVMIAAPYGLGCLALRAVAVWAGVP